jgi:hypothetical protein
VREHAQYSCRRLANDLTAIYTHIPFVQKWQLYSGTSLVCNGGYAMMNATLQLFDPSENLSRSAQLLQEISLRDMKAIFASLNLNNEDSNMPSNLEKRKASIVDASLAAHQEVYETEGNIHGITTSPQGDAYGLGFDHGRGFWGDQQGGGAFGIQKQ